MKSIYKYPIETTDTQYIEMPMGAEILTVQLQNGIPCIWAIVDTEKIAKKILVNRTIHVYRTGHDVKDPECLLYIGTYQMACGALVFHVFEDNTIYPCTS